MEIVCVTGKQIFTFENFVLEPNETVKLGDSKKNSDV